VRNGYISLTGILGRESYVFDPAEPRFVAEMLESPLDAGSPAFGANHWTQRYRNVRTAEIILNALEKVTGFSNAELEAIRGFTKTIMALDLLLVINTRDDNGAVIDVDVPVSDPGALVGKAQVFAQVAKLLDEGKAHLQAGGSAFPFQLSAGFAGFDTPATFLKFNRALRARVAVYMGSMGIGGTAANYGVAIQALQESFVSTAAPLDLGVYHAYGTGSGDEANVLLDPTVLAHPGLVKDAELKADGKPDDRVQEKLRKLSAPAKQRGLETDVVFTIYPSLGSPVAIIRNEELILLRAEANIGLGNVKAASDDINFIRQNAGGLKARNDLTAANVLDELLKQKRYSLMFEGHRWIDLRRYGKLNDSLKDLPAHFINRRFPVPNAECLARGIEGECKAS
ncbi:MAG: RagB/SusD family nutrient uptake outer membrane protein, partial [Gemmatimonadetes bacterium]|nr:RagB/SusD family nutrient uptake outer membrane protein [Gemmatimonadota bacterium]